MAEYIGSRISLISKRDVRCVEFQAARVSKNLTAYSYVGVLHEISSENSTVALENVRSYGTEGRSAEEIAPSDDIYEYIVFRGSDVKDLRIEKEPEKRPEAAKVPDDPAILGQLQQNARPIGPMSSASQAQRPVSQARTAQFDVDSRQSQYPANSKTSYGDFDAASGHARFQQHAQQAYPYGAYPPPPPPNQRFGPYGHPQGFPSSHGPYPSGPYGPPPPVWYPPGPQGYGQGATSGPPPPHAYHSQITQNPGDKIDSAPPFLDNGSTSRAADAAVASAPEAIERAAATVRLPSQNGDRKQNSNGSAPPPPTASKPGLEAALAPANAASTKSSETQQVQGRKDSSAASKAGRILPAVPIASPKPKNSTVRSQDQTSTGLQAARQPGILPAPNTKKTNEDSTRDARAAVAAAMAKLSAGSAADGSGHASSTTPAARSVGSGAVDNLTRKVQALRTNDHRLDARDRNAQDSGTSHGRGGRNTHRGGVGGGRARADQQRSKVEVPKTDYDFAQANAKFNKQDLVKEAIANGDPIGISSDKDGSANTGNNATQSSASASGTSTPTISVGYNKTSSFFDNISSESKSREDASANRMGGREFRSEEQKKNLETFGQGSVDSGNHYHGHRGGYRGRGRGRGGARGGRGGPSTARGGVRAPIQGQLGPIAA